MPKYFKGRTSLNYQRKNSTVDTSYEEAAEYMFEQEKINIYTQFVNPECPLGAVYTTSPGFSVAPVLSPAIEKGMTATLAQLGVILNPRSRPSMYDLKKVPALLRRCRHLLHVYYSYQVLKEDSDDLKFCDFEHPAEISYRLCILGESLRAYSTTLPRLLVEVPDFCELVLQDLPPLKERLKEALEGHHRCRKKRPGMNTRNFVMLLTLWCEGYRAEDQWLMFVAPIWFWCHNPANGLPKAVYQRALELHISCSSTLDRHFQFGTAPFCTIAWGFRPDMLDSWLDSWLWNGGLLALVQSTIVTNENSTFGPILLGMGPQDWSCLRLPGVAENIMRALLFTYDTGSLDDPTDGRDFVGSDKKPAIIRTVFAIYREFGHEIFATAAEQAFKTTKFAYLAKQLAKHSRRYHRNDKFVKMFSKHDRLPPVIRQRYAATLFEGAPKLEIMESVGCMNPTCRMKAHWKKLVVSEANWESYSQEDRAVIEQWGCDTKFCGRRVTQGSLL